MKKILIIDEKLEHADGSGFEFTNTLNCKLDNYVDFFIDLSNCIKIINPNEVDLLFNQDDYDWILFHDSYHDHNLDYGQMTDFKRKAGKVVIFSGGVETIGFKQKVTSRIKLFSILEKALLAGLEYDIFPIKCLFDNNINLYYPILDQLEDFLLQGDKQSYLGSTQLNFILRKMNYSQEDINNSILPNFTNFTAQQLNEKIELWRRMDLQPSI